jgi:hypothetical protein
MAEERRVHQKTHEILSKVRIKGIVPVLNYKGWRSPEESIHRL